MGPADDPTPPTLDYRSPTTTSQSVGRSLADKVTAWVRYRGPDSFIGALALTLAGVFLCGLSLVFTLVALVERGTSKTFPLASIVLVALYIAVTLSVSRLIG